jgi:predicted polyphosphate/ATP-dependent NAD kinase
LSFVGIIANPASGKDIRRLVSHATVVNNHEKVGIVRRLLLALYARGVQRVEIMPDHFGIGARALSGLRNRPEVLAGTSLIDMAFDGAATDSLRAARSLRDVGAGCIVVLGGDGTCRVVARGLAQSSSQEDGDVPLLPLSTGTNNVVPGFIESTIAGAAAAYVALHPDVEREQLCNRHKRLLVYLNSQLTDQALVEVALVATSFVGARAVWKTESLRQVFVSRAQPTQIGLSSILGIVHPVDPTYPGGAFVSIVPDGKKVLAPIAPGAFAPVGIGEIGNMNPGIRYPVHGERPAVLALDGEREITLRKNDEAHVALALDGPWIVDVERTLQLAVQEGTFLLK